MIRSMTAYANGSARDGDFALECEIRSVNHRYLDVQFRLPELLRRFEPQLRELVRQQLRRGKVECSFRYRLQGAEGGLQVDLERAGAIIQAARQIAALADEESAPDPLRILGWPGVLQEAEPDLDSLEAVLLGLFQEVLDDLQVGREREGHALAGVIRERAEALDELAAGVRDQMPEILAQFRARLEERLEDLPEELSESRIEAELVLLAQRADVAEELDRIDAHLAEVHELLEGREQSAGKRLDFLAQELNREANTLASKSVAVFTSQQAIDAKVLIEQLREQIQNIE